MFDWFSAKIAEHKAIKRCVLLEIEIEAIKRRMDNLDIDLREAKYRKRIIKTKIEGDGDETSPATPVILPESYLYSRNH